MKILTILERSISILEQVGGVVVGCIAGECLGVKCVVLSASTLRKVFELNCYYCVCNTLHLYYISVDEELRPE